MKIVDREVSCAIGAFTESKDSKTLDGGTWNATYVIDGDKVRIKLLAVSLPPPAK